MIEHFRFKDIDIYVNSNENMIESISFDCDEAHIAGSTESTLYQQLSSYFMGELEQFDLELNLTGTDFQQSVWQALRHIPYGKTVSYFDVAKMVGKPLAVRAVGTAIGKNPIPIIIPCHRVIKKDGQIGQFTGGVNIKEKLLEIETHE